MLLCQIWPLLNLWLVDSCSWCNISNLAVPWLGSCVRFDPIDPHLGLLVESMACSCCEQNNITTMYMGFSVINMACSWFLPHCRSNNNNYSDTVWGELYSHRTHCDIFGSVWINAQIEMHWCLQSFYVYLYDLLTMYTSCLAKILSKEIQTFVCYTQH